MRSDFSGLPLIDGPDMHKMSNGVGIALRNLMNFNLPTRATIPDPHCGNVRTRNFILPLRFLRHKRSIVARMQSATDLPLASATPTTTRQVWALQSHAPATTGSY